MERTLTDGAYIIIEMGACEAEYRLRWRRSQFFVMRVADPADFSFDVDRAQRPEASRAGVDAKVAGEVLPVGRRRCVEDGMRVDRAVDPEVQIRHSAVASRRQHLGQHRHHAVFVLRKPHIPVHQQQPAFNEPLSGTAQVSWPRTLRNINPVTRGGQI